MSGTSADFYMGRGPDAEYLGSVRYDGYPNVPGVGSHIDFTDLSNSVNWRARVAAMLAGRDDAVLPAEGWPWPYPTSLHTDFAYAWDEGQLWIAGPREDDAWETYDEYIERWSEREAAEFPDFSTAAAKNREWR